MKTSNYKNFKMPLPVRGRYEFSIVDAKDVKGTKEDENGDCSTGIKLTMSVNSPADALMTDGSPAVGFTFDQTWWEPRQSLQDSKPETANRMKRDIARLIEAVFGDTPPDEIAESDWIGRNFFGDAYSKFDDFKGEEVLTISKVVTGGDSK